jgi:hypothetical protein|tara:strand:- start:2009 stop:2188 length:180 start_codon:yes stop_codon:yes gene_type:complete
VAVKKSKKKYSLYQQGVSDAIEYLDILIPEAFGSDPRSRMYEVEEKLKYIQNKLKDLIT